MPLLYFITAQAELKITRVKWLNKMTTGSVFTLMKYPGKNAWNNGKPINFPPNQSC